MSGQPTNVTELYDLLPAVYRERDAAEGYPLRALLGIIDKQAGILRSDIGQLWDNYFIETCDPWVIPYIGDLVDNNLLYDESRVGSDATALVLFEDLAGPDLCPEVALRTRADVAKTIYYRRRKGTPPMLEELARDVTGWAAHAVEFFQLLDWTQHLNYQRPASLDCMDLRCVEPVDRVDSAFDIWSHTVDVRPPSQSEGWHNIPNIGFFLWRLGSYPLEEVQARHRAGSLDWRYYFSPLGNSALMFNALRREGDEAGMATELHVPGPIRPAFWYEDIERHRRLSPPPPRPDTTDLYGPLDENGSFFIVRNGVPVDPAADLDATPEAYEPQIVCRRLDPWPAVQPSGPVIAVDVTCGRIAIGDGWGNATESLDVSYHYGFSADLGGGPYERGKWLVDPELTDVTRIYVRQDGTALGGHSTLGSALTEWAADKTRNTVITMLDNRSYEEDLEIDPDDDAWLVIEAATGVRPHIRPEGETIRVTGVHPDATLTLSGLLVEGAVDVQGDLGRLRLLHTTLVPGRSLDEDGQPAGNDPSVLVAEELDGEPINADFKLQLAFSITGPIRVPGYSAGMWLLDSIVDGIGGSAVAATGSIDQPVPAATLERVTIFGFSHFKQLTLATEVIFTEPVIAEQRHEGCVRFSYVPTGSRTPRRYRCQPDWQIRQSQEQAEEAKGGALTQPELDAIAARVRAWLVPSFTAEDYGLPAYAQLRMSSPVQIRTGAEDGSEMGAFCHLKQAQRLTNLRIRLDEYLPFGLVPGFTFVT